MRVPGWIRVSQRVARSRMSRSDELLCGMGCANLVLAFYAVIVHFERESDGPFALLLLSFGIIVPAFLARRDIAKAFTSRWKARLWVITLLYGCCVVWAVSYLIHGESLEYVPTWPVEQAICLVWGIEYPNPVAAPIGFYAGGVLYCFVLFALWALYCGYWHSLKAPPASPLETS